MITVTLSFFAAARDLIGLSQVDDFELSESRWQSTADLLDHLCVQFPALIPLRPALTLAVNEEYTFKSEQVILSDGDRIAVIPPITGG